MINIGALKHIFKTDPKIQSIRRNKLFSVSKEQKMRKKDGMMINVFFKANIGNNIIRFKNKT